MIGREVEVICDGWDEDAEAYACRTKADAPEIDGVVYVESEREIARRRDFRCARRECRRA